MSRYNLDGYAYGFDNPLSQYFLSKGRKHFLGPLSETYGDNNTMYDLLRKQGLWDKLPKEHKIAILGDHQF